MSKYTIAVPEILNEIDCYNNKQSIIMELKKALDTDGYITVKFVTGNEGYFRLSSKPEFKNGIAPFRVYLNNRFLKIAELIKR